MAEPGQRSAFEAGFFGARDPSRARSGEYQLGDGAARGLAAAMHESLAEPDEMTVRRRMAALRDDDAVRRDGPRGLRMSGYPVAAAAVVLLAAGVLLYLARGGACGDLLGYDVVDCSSSKTVYIAALEQRYSRVELARELAARPAVRASIAALGESLDAAQATYVIVDMPAAALPPDVVAAEAIRSDLTGLVLETRSEAEYLGIRDRLADTPDAQSVAAELTRLLDAENPDWEGDPHQTLVSLVNLY